MHKYLLTVLSAEKQPYSRVKDFHDDIDACKYAQDLADIYDGIIFDVRLVDTNRLVDHFKTY